MKQEYLQQNPTDHLEHDTQITGLMEAVLSNFPVVLFRLDKDGIFIESTGAGLKRLGLRRGEVIGKSALEMYPNVAESLREALAGGEIQFETQGVTDGCEWWFDTYVSYDSENGGARGFAIDITSKKRSSEALQRQERRFGELLEIIPHGIVEIDMGGRIVFCNHGFSRLLSVRHGALLGRDLADFEVTSGGSETLKTYLTSVVEHGATCAPYITVLRSASGDDINARVDWNCKRDESGAVVGFVSIVTDITSQHQAQEALLESEDKFSKSFHVCPDAMAISLLPHGEIIEVNDGFLQMTGFTRKEVLGKTSSGLGIWEYPDERTEFVARLREQQKVREMQVHFRMKTGSLRTCLISAELFELGGRTYSLSLTKDITDRHEAERILIETKDRLELALNAARSGIWDWNIQTGEITFNERWAEILGYKIDELATQIDTWRNLVHVDDLDRVCAEWGRYEAGEISSYESSYRMRSKNGDYRIVSDTGRIVECDETGAPLRAIGVQVDITERSKREQERMRIAKLESVGVLAGGIAHDFNNILTAIVGELNLIRLGVADGDDVSDDINACENRALKATELTQQLLSYAHGGDPLRTPLEVGSIVNDAVEMALYGFSGELKNIAPERPYTIYGDKGQLKQALSVLLVNAAEATSGAGVVTVSVTGSTLTNDNVLELTPGEYVTISIADNGAGISEENLTKVFDPYFTTKKGASGLGLTGAHSIAQKHGGAISVQSIEGESSTFSLLIPELLQPELTQAETICKGELAMNDACKRKGDITGVVLLMDDEASIRKVAKRSLTRLGYTVHLAVNGEKAISIYQQQMQTAEPIDVVILDLTIAGGMGGAEALKMLKEIDPRVTAFVSSGYSNDPVMANYKEYGFSRVVAKPYRIAELHSALQEALARRTPVSAS